MSDAAIKTPEDFKRAGSNPGSDAKASFVSPDDGIENEAREASEIIDAKANSWNVIDALAFFYAQYGKVRHARALYASLYARFPKNSRYGLGLASARLACEDYEGCLKLSKYLAATPDASASVFFLMARSYHALGQQEEAQAAVQTFIEKNDQQSKVPAPRPAKNRANNN